MWGSHHCGAVKTTVKLANIYLICAATRLRNRLTYTRHNFCVTLLGSTTIHVLFTYRQIYHTIKYEYCGLLQSPFLMKLFASIPLCKRVFQQNNVFCRLNCYTAASIATLPPELVQRYNGTTTWLGCLKVQVILSFGPSASVRTANSHWGRIFQFL